MSRTFTKNTSNYMTVNNAANWFGGVMNGASVICFHARIFPYNLATDVNGIFVGYMSGNNVGLSFRVDAGGLLTLTGRSVSTDSSQTLRGKIAIEPFKWWSVGGVANYTSQILEVYVNGELDSRGSASGWANSTYTDSTGTTPDQIGGQSSTLPPVSTNGQFDGCIADVALWRGAIGHAEFGLLARGRIPGSLIRPSANLFFAPLQGRASPEPNFPGSGSGTSCFINGTILEGPDVYPYIAPEITTRGPVSVAAPAVTQFFRRSSSRVGTRIGTRQTWAV